MDRPASDPDWFKARKSNGQVGLVPRNYLQELSEFLTQPLRETNGVPNNHHNNRNGSSSDRNYLLTKNWYFGNVSRSQCDQLLNDRGLDGDFLIRDSETNVRNYFLTKVHVYMLAKLSRLINTCFFLISGWGLLCVTQSPGQKQAFQGSRRKWQFLYWSEKVYQSRSIS